MEDEQRSKHQLIGELRELRERHGRELAESEERFTAFVGDAAFGYGESDLEGRVTLANPFLEELTGYSQGEIVGRTFLDFVDERDHERAIRDLALVLTEPNDGPREYRLRRKDGATRHVDINTIPIVRDGAVVGFRSTMVDVTARRMHEDALEEAKRELEHRVRERTAELAEANRELERQYRKLVRANEQLERLHRTKDEFIATISHELRTPLVTGLGYIELLLAGKLGSTGDGIEAPMRVAQRNLQRLSGLIDDLLSYHTMVQDEPGARPKVAPFDAGNLLGECRADFLVRTSRPVERIVLEVPAEPLVLEGDEELIHRVISNLLNNADQHAGEDARIALEASRPEGGRAVLAVRDDGVGMAEAARRQAFEPFFKASGGRGGAGLGLAIVRSIVAAHGETVCLESEEGRGTRIAFSLPVARGGRLRRRTKPPILAKDRPTRDATVLIVDDDQDTLEFLELLLSHRGYDVKIALTAESALKIMKQGPVDLVILDLSLPGMDGDQLCSKIREEHPTAELPVLFLTARAEESARLRAERAGASAYMIKPVEVAELVSGIREVLEPE